MRKNNSENRGSHKTKKCGNRQTILNTKKSTHVNNFDGINLQV